MQTEVEHRIKELLEKKFEDPEFEDCFIVEVRLDNKKLNVFVDSDTNITFEKCRKLSRYLESYIDENGWLGEKYILEVSSPGIGRPLKFARQYQKNVGRKLEVKHNDEVVTGTLTKVAEDKIVLENKVRIKEGKRKKTVVQETEIPLDEISSAIVQITFKK